MTVTLLACVKALKCKCVTEKLYTPHVRESQTLLFVCQDSYVYIGQPPTQLLRRLKRTAVKVAILFTLFVIPDNIQGRPVCKYYRSVFLP